MESGRSPLRTWLYVSVVVAIVICASWAGLYYFEHKNGTDTLLTNGVTALNNGDYSSAVTQFEEAMTQAKTVNERGYFETLLASSYEATDFKKAADTYLSVINNSSYRNVTRGLAAAYLMKALKSYQNFDYGTYVFSKAPFEGFLGSTSTPPFSEPIAGYDYSNYALNAAIARGDEWAIQQYPNFLSHFSLSKFYAGYYGRFLPELQKSAAPKIAQYFNLGNEELAEAAGDPEWSTELIGYGYSLKALAAEQILDTMNNRGYSDSNLHLDFTTVDTYFGDAYHFADQNAARSNSIKNLAAFDRLYYAQFLLHFLNGQKTYADKLTQVAEEMNSNISASPEAYKSFAQSLSGSDPSTLQKKKMLIVLTGFVPALKQALVGIGALSAADFK